MKKLIFCFLVMPLLLMGCVHERFITIDVDTSPFESHKDHYCSYVSFSWLPEGVYVLDGNYFYFQFTINKDHPFIQEGFEFADPYDEYGLFSIDFYFELDGIEYSLGILMGGGGDVLDDKVEYVRYMGYIGKNSRIMQLAKTTDKRAKIELFKEIIKDGKLYAVRPDGERLDFGYTKDTQFVIVKSKH